MLWISSHKYRVGTNVHLFARFCLTGYLHPIKPYQCRVNHHVFVSTVLNTSWDIRWQWSYLTNKDNVSSNWLRVPEDFFHWAQCWTNVTVEHLSWQAPDTSCAQVHNPANIWYLQHKHIVNQHIHRLSCVKNTTWVSQCRTFNICRCACFFVSSAFQSNKLLKYLWPFFFNFFPVGDTPKGQKQHKCAKSAKRPHSHESSSWPWEQYGGGREGGGGLPRKQKWRDHDLCGSINWCDTCRENAILQSIRYRSKSCQCDHFECSACASFNNS